MTTNQRISTYDSASAEYHHAFDVFLANTDPSTTKVKTMRFISGAQPYPAFKAQIDAMLSRSLGPGKGEARVNVDLNVDQTKLVIGIFIRPLLYLGIAYFLIMFALANLGPRFWDPKVGKWLLIFGLGAFFVSMLDPNFFLIAAKPDNVPIGAMIFLLGIFTWIALRKAYLNDKQIEAGGIPWEKTESNEKLFVWPDLVYTEMLCMILLTIVMTVWSVGLRAPLEEAANPTSSPNPAKA